MHPLPRGKQKRTFDKPATLLKVTFLHWCFSRFLYKWYQIAQSITYFSIKKRFKNLTICRKRKPSRHIVFADWKINYIATVCDFKISERVFICKKLRTGIYMQKILDAFQENTTKMV